MLLNAPVPAGLPQVSAGVTNQWSDVPPVSWSEWKDRLGGFGVVGRVQLQQTHQPEAGGSSGTPDNTRPAQRAPEGKAAYIPASIHFCAAHPFRTGHTSKLRR